MSYNDARAIGLNLDRRVHRVLDDNEWIRELRDRTGNDRLFVYHHRLQRTFVLCAWVYSPAETDKVPIAMELEVSERAPWNQREGVMSFKVLVQRCRPDEPGKRRVLESVRAQRQRRRVEIEERDHAKHEMARHYEKMGLNHLAHLVRTGQQEVGLPDAQDDRVKEMIELTKGRVVGDLTSSGDRRKNKKSIGGIILKG